MRNPFGPTKALAIALAAVLTLVGLAFKPGALSAAVDSIRRSPLAWAIGALCGLSVLSAFTAIDVRQAFLGGYPDYRGLVSIVAYAIVGVGALDLWRTRDGARWLSRCFVAGALMVGGIGSLQRAGLFPAEAGGDFGKGWRVASTLGNSSNLGVYLVVLLPLVAWAALSDRDRGWRVAAWTGFALGALSLVWTLSRGAWLGAIIAVAAAGAYLVASRHLVRRRVAWLSALVLLMLLVGALLTPTFSSRVSGLLDPASSTAHWRLSTWRSSASMALARPFLGFGPNQFRFAYPRFEEAGQIDGRLGYPIVESAHNLLADTATSFGLSGLFALLAIGVLAAMVLWREARSDSADRGLSAALGLGLLGGTVALQFHYVTLDTGPLLAVVLAGLVGIDVARRRTAEASEPSAEGRWTAAARWGALALAVLYLAMAGAAAGLMGADRAAARAMRIARPGAPWAAVSAELSRAEALAPWEAQIVRVRGTAATAVVARGFDLGAARDGIRAFDAAVAMTPADAVLAAERGNLLLAAGIAAKDKGLLKRSVVAFGEAERMDPNTGIAGAGKGSALLALGRVDEATVALERAVELSPRYATGWKNLELAYRAAGRTADEAHAAKHWLWWTR
jgi:O-antigen ligase/Flp pilus assembly protein TadD